MDTADLIALLEKQIAARGLDPLSSEQIDLLKSESQDRDGMLDDLRDRIGLEIPADAWSRIPALALEFSRQLRATLTPEQMARVIARNKTYGPNVCASHDFCDANEVMLSAYEKLTGGKMDLQDSAACAVWGDAWEQAKATEFSIT